MNFTLLKPILIILVLLTTLSCKDTHECPECFTPPQELRLKITDKTSAEDLIFNGTYKSYEISITYIKNEKETPIEIEIIMDEENERAFILSYEIAWKSLEGFKNYKLHLSPNESHDIYINVVSKSDDCCTFHEYADFEINEEIINRDPTDNLYNFLR